jgi:hypothetical protein
MFAKLFDTLGNMGIWIRLNDKRTEPPSEEGRAWGEPVGNFALSLANRGDENVSILIKNIGAAEVRTELPGWLHYLQVEITGPDGAPAALKPFGKQALSDPHLAKPVERVFPAGKYLVTDIPVGALYDMTMPGAYRIRVSCAVPGQAAEMVLYSNEIAIMSA